MSRAFSRLVRAGWPRAAAFSLLLAVLAPTAFADIVVTEAWSRATVPGVTTGVGYLVLTNNGDEKRSLLRITSPVCDTVMLHLSSVDSQGVARMWPIGQLELEPGQSIRFEPTGRHVMFMGISTPFKVGTKVPLVLQFDGGEKPVTVMLEVRPITAAASSEPRKQ